MGMDRRDFIKLAGLSTLLGLGSNSALELLRPGQAAAALEGEAKPLTAKRWAMVVNMRQLDEQTAQKCIAACDRVHNIPDFGNPIDPAMKLSAADKARWEIKWIWTEPYENAFPGDTQEYMDEKVRKLNFLLLCNHCDNPPCVRVCPTKATFRQEDGIVMMDMHRCIGCRFCMAACPFGARSFNWKDPRPYIKEAVPRLSHPGNRGGGKVPLLLRTAGDRADARLRGSFPGSPGLRRSQGSQVQGEGTAGRQFYHPAQALPRH